jgi:hypothetical protein
MGEVELCIRILNRDDGMDPHCYGWISIRCGGRLWYLNLATTREYHFDRYEVPTHGLFDDNIDEKCWIGADGYVYDAPQAVQIRKLIQDLQPNLWRFVSPLEDSITITTQGG